MDPKLLREATRPEHEATENTVPLLGENLTREHYLAVLQRFYGIICAWDSFAEQHVPEVYRVLVGQRRRSASLEEDIRFFGGTPQAAAPGIGLQQQMLALVDGAGMEGTGMRAEVETEERDARFLGAMYVIEGSTLGGQYIAKHVEDTLKLKRGEGDRYFRGYGEQTMPMWREFQQEVRNLPEDRGPEVIRAAKGMFAIFGRWMEAFDTPVAIEAEPVA